MSALQDVVPASLKFYGRDGEEIDIFTWEALVNSRWEEAAIATKVGPLLVSTLWEGLDHRPFDRPSSASEGPPLIWETATCLNDSWTPRERYSTEKQAREGHARWVAHFETHLKVGEAE